MEKDFNNTKEVITEVEGKEILGRCTVSGGMVTVISEYGQKSVQKSSLGHEAQAKQILRELFRGAGRS